ncbi:MAG: alpha/beta hydrolase [Actinomycetia bacterium]|nr:alpha/beta hydrolase [Actinomycetes bacterium]
MSTTSTSDGVSISFEVHGEAAGPPVILVHGITESSNTWRPVTEQLAKTHRVVTLDLRGHGNSADSTRYDLEAMANDVIAVVGAVEADNPHLVGHSLGGAVVSAVGAAIPVRSVVNVDQSLQLGSFKDLLMPVEPMLRDASMFPAVIDGLFSQMAGEMISPETSSELNKSRRASQEVVLGVWELIFTMSAEEIDAVVAGALAGYSGRSVNYLSLFGIDPGDEYAAWLRNHIDGAVVELWPEMGHYPHLVDPGRFIERLERFWSTGS